MMPEFSSIARMGLVALGLSAAAISTSSAGQGALGASGQIVAQSDDEGVVPVEDSGEVWRRRGAWNNNGDFNDTRPPERRGNGGDDDGGGRWRDGGERRHWNPDFERDGFRRYHRRPSVYFDLDLGPSRYVQPRYYVEPRRQYRRQALSRAHVAWCQDRYRSYRAWDNTFKPSYGPRKQCYSPYL